MKPVLAQWLACPTCQGSLRISAEGGKSHEQSGPLTCTGCGTTYPVRGGIPRFVPSDGYATSFSLEWTRFRTTQLDSATGGRRSEQRFQRSWNAPLASLNGKLILDAGCGMGRFAEVAVRHGATVVGVDLSYAVDAAAANLARWETAHVVQADLRRLPFRPGIFDAIYSLGVLHHTPSPRATFEALLPFLKPGGQITISLYSGYNKVYVMSTTLWRRLTSRLPKRWVFAVSHLAIPLYYVYRIPGIGLLGQALWPISMHPDPKWRLLDTFDCYTPAFQSYHTHPEVFRWFNEAGLTQIGVLEEGISFIGTRPTRIEQAPAQAAVSRE